MLAELDQEAGKTRKVLERISEDRFDFKPHERSMSMGQLASHIVEMSGWCGVTLDEDEFDIPADYKPWQASTSEELLARFDSDLAAIKTAMAGYPDAKLMQQWSLKAGGHVLFTLPRVAVIRSMILNHIIHHRGQLSVYLRLNEIPVPAIYGPSADEAS